MDETKQTFDCWAVLELFGHVRLAGHVTEASIGGCSFLRVDVPHRPDEGEGVKLTRYFGNGAIYSMTPVSEEVARNVGDGNAAPPVKPWEMPKAALPAARYDEGENEDEGDDPQPW
jgi:hypothetical protein